MGDGWAYGLWELWVSIGVGGLSGAYFFLDRRSRRLEVAPPAPAKRTRKRRAVEASAP
jgi:hypothetical protein